VIGKTSSCAAIALTFAAYVVPAVWQRPVAAMGVVGLAAVNLPGPAPGGVLVLAIGVAYRALRTV
jgi:hypothetical protein